MSEGDSGVPRGALGVDVSADRRTRLIFAVFLAGPVIWFTYFMLVYLVVEAACTGDGPGLNVFDPPVSDVVTLAATGVAAAASLVCARWAYRRWRVVDVGPEADERTHIARGLEAHARSLAFAGFVLSLLSVVAILGIGLPALFLPAC